MVLARQFVGHAVGTGGIIVGVFAGLVEVGGDLLGEAGVFSGAGLSAGGTIRAAG